MEPIPFECWRRGRWQQEAVENAPQTPTWVDQQLVQVAEELLYDPMYHAVDERVSLDPQSPPQQQVLEKAPLFSHRTLPPPPPPAAAVREKEPHRTRTSSPPNDHRNSRILRAEAQTSSFPYECPPLPLPPSACSNANELDAFPEPEPAASIGTQTKSKSTSKSKQQRVPRATRKTGKSSTTELMPINTDGDAADAEKAMQAKRKSEIEKRSRKKRASNMDTMKDRLEQLEQSLVQLVRFHQQKNDQLQQNHQLQQIQENQQNNHHQQLPLQLRLARLRNLLANQFQELAHLRKDHVEMYQQLHQFVDIKDSLTNVISAHDFSDPSIYDLLSWWDPPSDAECMRLAHESMEMIRSFQVSKRCVTNKHSGWDLAYDCSPGVGCKFYMTRTLFNIDVPTLAQTIWDARSTAEAASRMGGSLCRVEVSVIKAVTKDLMVVNRTLISPVFGTIRCLYLLVRTQVNGIVYIVSRDLGRSKDLTWDQATRDFPETSANKWVDMFAWSSFQKVPDDSSNDNDDAYLLEYGGWWGATHALGLNQWMLEIIFMVVRWENFYVRPQLLVV